MIRGINVSGKNVITMEALRSLVAACGCRDLRTYIQSGNVVLSSPSTAAACAAAVEQALAKRLGQFSEGQTKGRTLGVAGRGLLRR